MARAFPTVADMIAELSKHPKDAVVLVPVWADESFTKFGVMSKGVESTEVYLDNDGNEYGNDETTQEMIQKHPEKKLTKHNVVILE